MMEGRHCLEERLRLEVQMEGKPMPPALNSARTATIVSIPINTADVDFVFREVSGNFQEVTVQGRATYRIAEPRRIASLLDYTVEPRSRKYLSQDPAKLPVRLVHLIQEALRVEIQRLSLEDILLRGSDLARSTLDRLRAMAEIPALGLEVLGVFVASVNPTPEVAKALEADYREVLLKRADQAIYDRRAKAVEQERKIQENQLGTDIALEEERARLVELKATNLTREAEAEARALEVRLAPYRTIDPRILMALGVKALGDNAAKISNLTITPEVLAALLGAPP
jgi:regulator of protease activity HflC (stomatin/prohibitin superfamily)